MTKQAIKILIGMACAVVVALFITGIVQTFVLNSYVNKLQTLQSNAKMLEENDAKANETLEYRETQDYIDDYFAKQGYVDEGEQVYK